MKEKELLGVYGYHDTEYETVYESDQDPEYGTQDKATTEENAEEHAENDLDDEESEEKYEEKYEEREVRYETGYAWGDTLLYQEGDFYLYFHQSGSTWFDDDAGSSTEIGSFDVIDDEIQFIPIAVWSYTRSLDGAEEKRAQIPPPYQMKFYMEDETNEPRYLSDGECYSHFRGRPDSKEFSDIWKRALPFLAKK